MIFDTKICLESAWHWLLILLNYYYNYVSSHSCIIYVSLSANLVNCDSCANNVSSDSCANDVSFEFVTAVQILPTATAVSVSQ
jgi:hypothetical protein